MKPFEFDYFFQGILSGSAAERYFVRERSSHSIPFLQFQSATLSPVVDFVNHNALEWHFFGLFAGDYWIIGLDEKDYSWPIDSEFLP